MELVKVECEVPKEAYELANAIVEVVKASHAALKDGFQVGADLPVIITQAVVQIPKAVDGINKLPEEAKLHPSKLALAFAIAAEKVAAEFIEKK